MRDNRGVGDCLVRRSEINTILADAEDFIHDCGVTLPPFAYWDVDRFKEMVGDSGCEAIVRSALGWTVTDFGLGSFQEHGLVVFTARMGDHTQLPKGRGRLYAEKFLVQREGQRTPAHCHRVKTEDVINRSDATFVLHLHHCTATGDLDEKRKLNVSVDGQTREFRPGEAIALQNGEGLTIEPEVYHDFTASGGDALAVEISLANDDANDNFFYDPVGVSLGIEEDEPPRRLLVQDYHTHFPGLVS